MRFIIIGLSIILSFLFLPFVFLLPINSENPLCLTVPLLFTICASGILCRNTYIAIVFNLLSIFIPILFILNFGFSKTYSFKTIVLILYYLIMIFVLVINMIRLLRVKREISATKVILEGKWIVKEYSTINKDNCSLYEKSTITFNSDGTGYSEGFKFNGNFKYMIDCHEKIPRTDDELDDLAYPKIIFKQMTKNKIYKMDYKLENKMKSTSNIILCLGDEYAFSDNFRGGYDENGNLKLIIEDYFKLVKI